MTDLAYWGRIEFLITFLAIYTIVFVGVQYANPSWVFRKAGRPIQWGMVAIWAAFFLVMAGMCIALSNTAYPPRNIFGWLAVVAYSAIGAVSVGFASMATRLVRDWEAWNKYWGQKSTGVQ